MATKKNARKKTNAEIEAENAAQIKETRIYTLIGITTVVILTMIALLIGFVIWHGNQPKTASVSPSFTTSNGAIVVVNGKVDDNGKRWDNIDSKDNNTINHLPVIANGQDPLCPGCGALEREIGDTVEYWSENNQIVYKQWPLSILDRLSNGARYSTRVAADFYRFAELDPADYLKFVSIMCESGIQPSESAFVNIDDSKIQEYGKKAGLTDEQAKQLTDGKYQDFVEATTSNLSKDKSLWRDSGDGQSTFMTPLLILNGELVQDYSTDDMTTYIANKIGLTVPSDSDKNTTEKTSSDSNSNDDKKTSSKYSSTKSSKESSSTKSTDKTK
jgi:hypothetical protein